MKNEFKIHGDNGPLVVIENGLGNSMYPWYRVIEALKNKARIVTYHRKGYGNSEVYDTERTVSNISKELYDLLETQDLLEPLILVGHSFGGLIAQYFSLKYSELINGLVLVDSTTMEFERLESTETPVFNKVLSIKTLTDSWMKSYMMNPEEFLQTINSSDSIDNTMPVSWNREMKEFSLKQQMYKTISDEMLNFKSSSIEIKGKYRILDIPLTVLARDPQESINNFVKYDLPENEAIIFEEIASELQNNLTLLSNNSKLVIAKGCDHCIYEDNPEYVIKAIEEMIYQ